MAKPKHSISPQERRKGGADPQHHPSLVKKNAGQFHHDHNPLPTGNEPPPFAASK
jgi:hypothetical protein